MQVPAAASHHSGRRGGHGLPLRQRGPGVVFSCSFEAPRQGGAGMASVQEGWCVTPSGETVRFRVHDEQGGVSDGVRVYAGLRADPFFIDKPALDESQKTGRLAFKEVGTNSAIGPSGPINVLSIVVEADCRPWLRAAVGHCWRWSAKRWSPASSRSASSGSAARRSRTLSCK